METKKIIFQLSVPIPSLIVFCSRLMFYIYANDIFKKQKGEGHIKKIKRKTYNNYISHINNNKNIIFTCT